MSGPNESNTGRRVRAGSNVAVSVIAAAAVLLMLNYLGMRHYVRADWTSSGMYTLSEKSTKVLGTLDKDVQLYTLWSQTDPSFPDIKELLDRYAAASSRISLDVIDPDLNPDRVKMIIDKYGAKMQDMGQGMVAIEASVIAVSGENVKFITSGDFEEVADPFGGHEHGAEGLSSFKAEQELTAAILRVTADEQVGVCFTQGHGEWMFEGFGGRALGHIKEGLLQDSYRVEALAISGASKIPGTCDLVVVAGPEKGLREEEAALLERYLERGGRVLLLLDPLVEGDRFVPTGLEGLTARQGIELANTYVLEVDARRLVNPSPMTFLASEFTTHDSVRQLSVPDGVGAEIKEQMGAFPVVFAGARSLAVREGTDTVAEPLARSSEASWGEVDLASLGTGETAPGKDQYDVQGPTTVAMAATLPGEGPDADTGRLAVVGDSDFLSEELFVNAGLYNRDFWGGLIGWLTARADLISIAPKNPEHVQLNLTDDDVGLFWQVVIGELLLCIVIGVIVWIRRRS